MWWDVLLQFAETKNYCSENYARSVANFGPTLVASSWAGEVFLSTPSASPSRPTLGLEVYEFYLNLLSFSVFLPSFFTVLTVFSPNHTHLMNSSVTADWNGGDG